jgi:hypothetical protein
LFIGTGRQLQSLRFASIKRSSPYIVCGSPVVTDPMAEVVTLLQPVARFSKVVKGAGAWRLRRSEAGQPFYCELLGMPSRFGSERTRHRTMKEISWLQCR